MALSLGVKWSAGIDSEETLAGWRATYEPLLDGLGSALLLSLPGWIAADDAADQWRGGHRGLIASRLIKQLSDRMGGGGRKSRLIIHRMKVIPSEKLNFS